MKTFYLVVALVTFLGVSEARAERISVAVAKGVVKAVKVVPNPAPAVWGWIKWFGTHV